jgi:hypothetical protein
LTACRIAAVTVEAVPSISFSATLPVKPSVTTTSATPFVTSLPSTLPTKLRPDVSSASRACAATTSSVPFFGSSPFESRPTRGRAMPFTASMNCAPM